MGSTEKQGIGKTPAIPSGWDALSLPLQECGEIAVIRFANGLAEALRLAADQLFAQSTRAFTPLERDAFLAAADFARMRRQGLVEDFRKRFQQGYVQACLREPVPPSVHRIQFDASSLKIIDHHLLEDVLDPLAITEAVKDGTRRSAQDLANWFRVWLRVPELDPNELPLGPNLIGSAVADAVREQLGRHEAKHRLMQVLCRSLPTQVNLVYRDLASHLDIRHPTSTGPVG
jgi:hypothetical protein